MFFVTLFWYISILLESSYIHVQAHHLCKSSPGLTQVSGFVHTLLMLVALVPDMVACYTVDSRGFVCGWMCELSQVYELEVAKKTAVE